MERLPTFLKKFFWDVEFGKIDPKKNRVYFLKRILELGDERAVSWMWKNFDKEEMKDVLLYGRGFTKKSANFWALILNVPREKILCLRQRLSKAPKIIWPY